MATWMLFAALFCGAQTAILPPPWADIRRNPCAAHPRGWLMLYWPSDGKCYTIYQKGHPCPETQELSPAKWGSRTVAECKCPPGTAQLSMTTTCHKLFERGPCKLGEYFAPVEETFNKRGERQGVCVRPQACADDTLLYWPPDGRCYYRRSQGPCYPGTLLDIGEDGLAKCDCESSTKEYWALDGGCYPHYSRGPCELGQLFLPGARCGCENYSPHYHNETAGCYELDSIGPCPKGHIFSVTEVSGGRSRAECVCRTFHARAADGACYRLYTTGPCPTGQMITTSGKCTKVPCGRGRLYAWWRRRCYRPGAREPCPGGGAFAYDWDARPAHHGPAHNGVCACDHGPCHAHHVEGCSTRKGTAAYNGTCHTLYTQGPCAKGNWLIKDDKDFKCQCREDKCSDNKTLDTSKEVAVKS